MRSSAQPQTGGVFQSNILRSPEPSNNVRRPSSIDRYPVRTGTAGGFEFPQVDAQARYSISYIPGMSEHVVNTGKTLPEAQLKVVLLACEVERLNTLNYNFVKENEILKAKARKTDREADLETKLAIVLAENEKLNQIVEELQSVYAQGGDNFGHNQDYERRISELLVDLEEWKNKYQRLEIEQPGNQGLQIQIEDLQRERDALQEQLGRQERDLEALRVRLNQVSVGPADVRTLQEQLSILQVENEKYKTELETMKLQYGNADALQQRLSQYDSKLRILLTENDKLNNLLAEKVRELKEKERQPSVQELKMSRAEEEKKKSANPQAQQQSADQAALKRRIDQLTIQLNSLLDENHKLNDALNEKARANEELRNEVERLRRQLTEPGQGGARNDQLVIQINNLLDENRRLNEALADRLREIDHLRARILDLETSNTANKELRDKLSLLATETERLNNLCEELRLENEQLRRGVPESGVINVRVESLTKQVNTLLEENRRLNDLLAERARDSELLRTRLADIEAGKGALAELKSRLDYHIRETDRLNAVVAELRAENERLRLQQAQPVDQTRLSQALSQGQPLGQSQALGQSRLNQSATQGEENRRLAAQLHLLLEENRRLNDLLAQRSRDADLLRQGASDIEGSKGALTELRNRLDYHIRETDRLNALVFELRNEIERLKAQQPVDQTRQSQALSQAQPADQRLSQSFSQAQPQASEQTKRSAVPLAQSNTLLEENRRLTSQLNLLLDENRRLNDLLASRVRDAELLRQGVAEIEGSKGALTELKNRLDYHIRENDRLNLYVIELKNEIERNKAHQPVDQTRLSQALSQGQPVDQRLRESQAQPTDQRLRESLAQPQPQLSEQAKRSVAPTNQPLDQSRLDQSNAYLEENRRITIQLNTLLEDNNRLNALLAQRARDSELLNSRLADIEAGKSALNELKNRLDYHVRENERLNALLIETRNEVERLRLANADTSRISQLTDQINILLEENRRLNDAVEELRARAGISERENAQLSELHQKVLIVTSDNERLNAALNDRMREIDDYRRKYAELQQGSAHIEELRAKLSLVASENERLNNLLQEKLRELDASRARLLQLEAVSQQIVIIEERLRVVTAERDRLNGILLDQDTEVTQLRRRSSQDQDTRKRLEVLLGENERLNAMLAEKLRENENLRRRISELESGSVISGEVNTRLTLLTTENLRLQQELDVLRVRVNQDRTMELKAQLDLVLAERDRLLAVANEKSRELELKKSNVEQVKKAAHVEHVRVDIHEDIIKRLEERIQFLDDEVRRLTQLVLERDNELDVHKRRATEAEFIRQENDRLNRLLTDKLREIEELKVRVSDVATPNNLRTGLEAEYKRLLDVQITEISARFNEERQALALRVRELETLVQNQQVEIGKVNFDNNQLKQEIENWKQKYAQLEKQRAVDVEAARNEYENRIRESSLRRSQVAGGKPNANDELEDKVAHLTSELERAQEALKNSNNEAENLRRRLAEVEHNRAREIEDLRHQFDNSKKTSIEVREIQIKFNAERTAYETQILQLQQKASDYEAQVEILNAELHRINKINVQRLEELEDSRRTSSDLRSSQTLETTQLRAQIESYKANAFDVKQLAIKYSADKAADQSQIKQLKQLNENNKAEIEKLYELIEQRKVDFESLTKQNQELSTLLGELTRQTQSATVSNERISNFERQLSDITTSRDEFKKQAQRNSVELTRKNKELVDKLQELDVLKMKYEEALANYQALNAKLFEKLSHFEK